MNVEFVGKFYDNHSLTIINRNVALILNEMEDINLYITPLDEYTPEAALDKEIVKKLKNIASKEIDGNSYPDIQIRHSYPPVWQWPTHDQTKVVYIQPWEYPKIPFEWQYKWETFADHVVVPSNYIRDIAIRGGLNPNDISVVPNGYNDKLFNKEEPKTLPYGIDPNKFNYVYVGNSQWRKSLDLLINTWHKCFKSYDNARLIIKDNPSIYGKNNVLNEIVKMQYKTECAPVIYIDDNISDETMADIFKASKVVVHPYRAEGFGMHIQEAVACGCVPILPDKGPHQDFIPDEIGIRVPTNPKAIDITSGEIFAQKPGDSFTMMSSHTIINEPSGQHLEKALQWMYHSHDKKIKFEQVNKLELVNTWENVAKQYVEVLINVGKQNKSRRIR
jgi:glycosyltransferase involved in cell wall biosynthesis